MPELATATVLNGRYHILRPVGRGGMGSVYEAVDLRLHNTVAVKKMTAEGNEAERAFAREATLLAALRHPALPVVSDYFLENGSCYLVMQFIEGDTLAACAAVAERPKTTSNILRGYGVTRSAVAVLCTSRSAN